MAVGSEERMQYGGPSRLSGRLARGTTPSNVHRPNRMLKIPINYVNILEAESIRGGPLLLPMLNLLEGQRKRDAFPATPLAAGYHWRETA